MAELTVSEVAARLKVTPLTVRRWLQAGALNGIEQEDRARCRISESDLASFIDARNRGGVNERTERRTLVT